MSAISIVLIIISILAIFYSNLIQSEFKSSTLKHLYTFVLVGYSNLYFKLFNSKSKLKSAAKKISIELLFPQQYV